MLKGLSPNYCEISGLILLIAAAFLEVVGDALVRSGLRATVPAARYGLYAAGAAVLFAYAYAVNTPPWDFGRLLGIYVVCFFAAAQIVKWMVFHQRPSAGVLIGGAFIGIGGAVMTLMR
jgi:small multidrug resistance family-3 protein